MNPTRRWFVKAFSGAIAGLTVAPREAAAGPLPEYLAIDFEPVRPPEYEWQVLDDAGCIIAEGVSAFGDPPDNLILQPGRQYTYRTRGCGL